VDGEVKRLILGYMNGIQAIYMLPSLGRLKPRPSSIENEAISTIRIFFGSKT
jgi:hypothetical protein